MAVKNIDMWERIREADDDEIREFVATEKSRLGDMLQGFTITWCDTETEFQLTLFSDGIQGANTTGHPWPWGKGFILGRTLQLTNGDYTLEWIQQAGSAFYYLWKDEIQNLKRDLGPPKHW